jgi:hypothetical protein
VITPDDRTVTSLFLLAAQDLVITDSTGKMHSKNVDHLPPLLRSQALHTRLPRNRKLPYIGIALTVLLHLAIVGFLYLNRGGMPESIFFPKLFPLDETKLPKHDAPATPAVQPESKPGA